jgi:hypothetical protein
LLKRLCIESSREQLAPIHRAAESKVFSETH